MRDGVDVSTVCERYSRVIRDADVLLEQLRGARRTLRAQRVLLAREELATKLLKLQRVARAEAVAMQEILETAVRLECEISAAGSARDRRRPGGA